MSEGRGRVNAATDDLVRELDKARDTLHACRTDLERHAEANAALHCAERVMYSPLHARVDAMIAGLDSVIARYGDAADGERS